jgi:hypothetical protein
VLVHLEEGASKRYNLMLSRDAWLRSDLPKEQYEHRFKVASMCMNVLLPKESNIC